MKGEGCTPEHVPYRTPGKVMSQWAVNVTSKLAQIKKKNFKYFH